MTIIKVQGKIIKVQRIIVKAQRMIVKVQMMNRNSFRQEALLFQI